MAAGVRRGGGRMGVGNGWGGEWDKGKGGRGKGGEWGLGSKD
jgi:hypothetical protein